MGGQLARVALTREVLHLMGIEEYPVTIPMLTYPLTCSSLWG